LPQPPSWQQQKVTKRPCKPRAPSVKLLLQTLLVLTLTFYWKRSIVT
jgi:hypothetical protein